jgi:hypothetical protein
MYGRLNFMCGAGLDSFSRNVDATSKIFREKRREIRLCYFKFTTGIRRGTQDACKYLQDYVGCYQLIFEKAVPELGWMICEIGHTR